MKSFSFLCAILFITVASFSQKLPENKPALKALIKKYTGYSFQTTKSGYNGYQNDKDGPVSMTWDKWTVNFQGDKNQYIQLFMDYHMDGFGSTSTSNQVFTLLPYAKDQVVKKNNNKFGGGELIFYRKTIDGKGETEYIRLKIAPADQDEFIKMFQAVYKEYGCTLTERTS